MGAVPTIGFDRMPKQGKWAGFRARVRFHYECDRAREIMGTIVRDDAEAPGVMILQLDDGRYVLSTECQYSPLLRDEEGM